VESCNLDFRSYVSKEKSGAASPTFRLPSLADNHILLNGKIKKTTLDVLDMTPLKTSGLWRMAM